MYSINFVYVCFLLSLSFDLEMERAGATETSVIYMILERCTLYIHQYEGI
jgi:hypothetical protein